MFEDYIGQQRAFLKDYKQAAMPTKESDETILEHVIQYLDQHGGSVFTLPANRSKNHSDVNFPFSKRVYTQEYDGAISTYYTYIGETFEAGEKTKEQHIW